MLRGAIYGLGAAAIWGSMDVVTDVLFETIPPFTLLVIRLILGGVVLALILLRSGARLPDRRSIPRLLGVGLVGFGVSLSAQFVGTDLSNAVNGSVVTSASPAFILVFGALIIVDPLKADFSSEAAQGNVALAIASITWALYSVLVRWVSSAFDTLVVTLYAFAGGLMLAVPAMAVELSTQPIDAITPSVALGVLYLGIICTAVSMWMWNRAFALVDASIAALFFFAQPLVGALLGVILLGQQMTQALWIGGALIAGGVLLSLVEPKREREEEPAR